MNKKISLGAAITFSLIVAIAVFSITLPISQQITNRSLDSINEREAQYEKFAEINRAVRQRYYGEIDETKLMDSTAKGYVAGLDDYNAAYYSVDEYAKMVKDESRDTASTGIEVKQQGGELVVTTVYPDSPAAIADVRVDDVVIEIGETPVNAENAESMATQLVGPDGSQVSIQVRRGGEEIFVDLKMRVLSIPTINKKMIDGTKIAYLRVSGFDENTANQFSRILTELQGEDATGVVFDLRNTETYDMKYAYRVIDRIIPTGIIVTAKDNNGAVKETLDSDSAELTWPMVVIVNEETAGVGEIFAQVLKEYEKASVVGVNSAGRGLMPEIVPLRDGSAVKITVARYETAKGTSIEGEGVRPDYEILLPNVEGDNWKELSTEQDTQLSKAIEVVSAQ